MSSSSVPPAAPSASKRGAAAPEAGRAAVALAAAAAASSASSSARDSLRDRLASALPHGHRFGIHHISTPPTRTEPLCAAPPGHRPDKTYRESHFLALSVRADDANVAVSVKRASPGADQGKERAARTQTLVFAIEVFIFTTAYQTTLFVSKADSTGYLRLLNLPPGSPSPIRQVCAAFLAYLLDHRQRRHIQSVVNLFARAQAQYLFPGSVRNSGKHVLSDWGLVRWWCRVLNPLIEGLSNRSWGATQGYLLIPGLEESEMRAFLPQTPASAAKWTIGHPLERISHYMRDLDWVPPRCLIPGYPDDPKSRFRDELDEEVSKRKEGVGVWRSVKSLRQFWDMMAFRQECSSGRLTGFVWLVFDPAMHERPWDTSSGAAPPPPPGLATPNASFDSSLALPVPTTPPRRRVDIASRTPQSSPLKAPSASASNPGPSPRPKGPSKEAKKRLTGRIIPRAPRIKTHARNYLSNRPTTTAYYHWPREGRGDKIVGEAEYKRIVELLLHLDFSTLDKASGSSRRWLSEVGMSVGTDWEVLGRASAAEVPPSNGAVRNLSASGPVTNLTGLIRRSNVTRASEGDPAPKVADGAGIASSASPLQVNVLGADLVRKKRKDAENDGPR